MKCPLCGTDDQDTYKPKYKKPGDDDAVELRRYIVELETTVSEEVTVWDEDAEAAAEQAQSGCLTLDNREFMGWEREELMGVRHAPLDDPESKP